jgi:hypothetical protein
VGVVPEAPTVIDVYVCSILTIAERVKNGGEQMLKLEPQFGPVTRLQLPIAGDFYLVHDPQVSPLPVRQRRFCLLRLALWLDSVLYSDAKVANRDLEGLARADRDAP